MTVKIKTNLRLYVYEGNSLVDVQEFHNTWTDDGLNVVRDWISGDYSEGPISHIAWCESDGTERARDVVTQFDATVSKTLLIRQYLPSFSTSNGFTLQKIRAYNAGVGGVLFAEADFVSGIAKTSTIQITAEWTHTLADDGI